MIYDMWYMPYIFLYIIYTHMIHMIFDIWYMIHIMYSLYCNTCIGTSKYTIFLPTFFPETPPPSWARCCVLSNDHEHPNCQIFAGPNSNWLHHHKSHRAAIDFFVGFCWRNGCVLKMLNFECHMRGKWNSFAMILAYIDLIGTESNWIPNPNCGAIVMQSHTEK